MLQTAPLMKLSRHRKPDELFIIDGTMLHFIEFPALMDDCTEMLQGVDADIAGLRVYWDWVSRWREFVASSCQYAWATLNVESLLGDIQGKMAFLMEKVRPCANILASTNPHPLNTRGTHPPSPPSKCDAPASTPTRRRRYSRLIGVHEHS